MSRRRSGGRTDPSHHSEPVRRCAPGHRLVPRCASCRAHQHISWDVRPPHGEVCLARLQGQARAWRAASLRQRATRASCGPHLGPPPRAPRPWRARAWAQARGWPAAPERRPRRHRHPAAVWPGGVRLRAGGRLGAVKASAPPPCSRTRRRRVRTRPAGPRRARCRMAPPRRPPLLQRPAVLRRRPHRRPWSFSWILRRRRSRRRQAWLALVRQAAPP